MCFLKPPKQEIYVEENLGITVLESSLVITDKAQQFKKEINVLHQPYRTRPRFLLIGDDSGYPYATSTINETIARNKYVILVVSHLNNNWSDSLIPDSIRHNKYFRVLRFEEAPSVQRITDEIKSIQKQKSRISLKKVVVLLLLVGGCVVGTIFCATGLIVYYSKQMAKIMATANATILEAQNYIIC